MRYSITNALRPISVARTRPRGGELHSFISAMFVAFLLVIISAPQARAQITIEHPDVTIGVNGLACPFCAYGLEQKLKKLEAIEALTVHMEEGQVQVKLKDGATVTDQEIRAAVKDAGFTVTEITYADKGRTVLKEADTIGKRR